MRLSYKAAHIHLLGVCSTSSGNMTSPSGKLIANLVTVLGGETGVLGNNDYLKIEARAYFQFVDDRKYASVEINGIAPPGDTHTYHYQ